MKDQVAAYFQQERNESLLFLTIGVVAVGLSFWLWTTSKPDFYKGMACPVLLVGLIQVLVGTTVYFRSPSDSKRVTTWVESEVPRIQSDEIPRMRKVMKSFVVYRYVEMALIAAGLILILANQDANFWKGVGAGLFAQSTLMLLADFFAERRGANYLKQLMEYVSS